MDEDKIEIHDSILKDHEKRIFALESNQKEIMKNQGAMSEKMEKMDGKLDEMKESTDFIKGKVTVIVGLLNSGNNWQYLKYGGAVFGGLLLFKLFEIISLKGGV